MGEVLKTTFVEAFNAGVVNGFCNNVLQTVLAARAAGVHLHIAEAQLLQVNTTTTAQRNLLNSNTLFNHAGAPGNPSTDLTDEGSRGGLPHPRRSGQQSCLVSRSIVFPSKSSSFCWNTGGKND